MWCGREGRPCKTTASGSRCGRLCGSAVRRCIARGPAARQPRVLEGPRQPAGTLPDPPARRQHGLRLLRRTIAQVSGKSGGYYGCLAATKGACENKTLVRRTLAEKVILSAVQAQIQDAEHIAYVLRRVEEEIAKQRVRPARHAEAEGSRARRAEQRRLANFVDFIGEGRGSQALAKALVETERRVEQLTEEVDALRKSREKIFRPPPIEWIKDRLSHLQEVLEQRTARSAQLLRSLLGPIRLELRHARHRPPLLPRRHDPRRPRPHRRTAPRVRRAVRILCKGGDGGNRTHVRDRAKGGVYERSRHSDLTLDSPCRPGCRGPAPKKSPVGLERASPSKPAGDPSTAAGGRWTGMTLA